MRLGGLFIYPVKSLQGIALPESRVEPRGLAHDRRFMLVDPEGAFITQRETPALATIATAIEGERLRLQRPGDGAVEVPLEPSGEARRPVRCWDDVVPALPVSDGADRWLSQVVGRPVALVYMPDDCRRPVDRRYAPGEDVVSFADGFPFLLLGEASVADLNGRLAQPVGADRFRPNLLIAGSEPYAEDRWRRVRVGELVFSLPKPCARCVMVTTDQRTGARGKEPLATLARFRPRRDNEPLFGQNALVTGSGTLRVGDPVAVLDAPDPSPH